MDSQNPTHPVRPGPGGLGQREEQECFYGSSGGEPACLQLAREPLICSFLTAPHLWAEGQGGVRLGYQLDILGGTGRAEAVRAWVRQPPGISKETSKQFGVLALPVDRIWAQPLYCHSPGKQGKAPPGRNQSLPRGRSTTSPLASMVKEGSDLGPGPPFTLGQTLPLS